MLGNLSDICNVGKGNEMVIGWEVYLTRLERVDREGSVHDEEVSDRRSSGQVSGAELLLFVR